MIKQNPFISIAHLGESATTWEIFDGVPIDVKSSLSKHRRDCRWVTTGVTTSVIQAKTLRGKNTWACVCFWWIQRHYTVLSLAPTGLQSEIGKCRIGFNWPYSPSSHIGLVSLVRKPRIIGETHENSMKMHSKCCQGKRNAENWAVMVRFPKILEVLPTQITNMVAWWMRPVVQLVDWR